MDVFISWSGSRSRSVAELLKDWLPCVLQAAKPWISTSDIDRGSMWFSEIYEQLQRAAVGIVCLTAENKDAPWIVFESGALAKGLRDNRVCTLLIDLKPKDVEGPLAQLNHTVPNKDGILKLLETINGLLGEGALDSQRLQKVFETYWPQFESGLATCIKNSTSSEIAAKPRTLDDLLTEVVENTRTISSRLLAIERGSRDSWDTTMLRSPDLHTAREAWRLLANGRWDDLDSALAARQDTLAVLEARKLIAEGMPEMEVLDRVMKLVRDPSRVVAIMNRATRRPPFAESGTGESRPATGEGGEERTP